MLKIGTKYGNIWMGINKRHGKEHANLQFESEFVEILETESYDIFIDVGAAWGYFSVVACSYAEDVYAFEPFEPRRKLLIRNKEELKLDNLHISDKAIGTGNLKIYAGRRMFGPKTKVRQKEVQVEWEPLSKYMVNNIQKRGIIKIDVEGAELDVIESADIAGNWTNYWDWIWLIERHHKEGLGYSEAELYEVMKPLTGNKLSSRKWTHHYVFNL